MDHLAENVLCLLLIGNTGPQGQVREIRLCRTRNQGHEVSPAPDGINAELRSPSGAKPKPGPLDPDSLLRRYIWVDQAFFRIGHGV